MVYLFSIAFAIAIVLVSAVGYSHRKTVILRHGMPLRSPPNSLPLIGNGLLFLQDRNKLLDWFVKCERTFGSETFAIRVPSLPPGVVINDPKNLEYVLKNEGIFNKGDFFKRRSWDLFGNGIINADGDLWKVQRKAGLHFLSSSNLKVLIEIALPKYLNETILSLKKSTGSVVDLEAVFNELTTQLMGKMAYNMDMHANDSFSQAFEYASGATGKRFQNPLWQATEAFFGRKFRKAVTEVKEFGRKIVIASVEPDILLDGSELDGTSGSLIRSLLDSIDDHQMVADAALNYLSAGRDTTAQALAWTFDQLMRNQIVYNKVRQEAKGLKKLTPSNMPYTLATFYEGLRLYPPVPFEIKQCQESTVLPDGTILPQNAIVFWSIWSMNRSRSTWGEDSDVFRPERWIEDGRLINKSAFEYPVFNGGPRTCLGKKMAESISVMVIGILCRDFDMKLINVDPRRSKNSLTLPMEGGLRCILAERRSELI